MGHPIGDVTDCPASPRDINYFRFNLRTCKMVENPKRCELRVKYINEIRLGNKTSGYRLHGEVTTSLQQPGNQNCVRLTSELRTSRIIYRKASEAHDLIPRATSMLEK